MVRGLYTAAAGALTAQMQVDTIANNLANVNTSGFKRTLLQVESTEKMELYRIQTDPGKTPGTTVPGVRAIEAIGALGFGSRVYDTPLNFEQGPIKHTDNALDFAIHGKGFFAVQSDHGLRYTRDGAFVRNTQGLLSTQSGDLVLGQRGGIPVPNGADPVSVDKSGVISVGGRIVDKLRLVNFADSTKLRQEGNNLLVDTGNSRPAPATASINQGSLEISNANVIESMVGLITAQRTFDANEKMIQLQDDTTGRAVNDVGRSQR